MAHGRFNVGSTTKSGGWVEGRHDHRTASHVAFPSKRGDAFFCLKQHSRCGVANRQNHLGVEKAKLALHEGIARCLFFACRRPILRRPTSHDIGNGECLAGHCQLLFDHASKKRSRSANEWHASFIFFRSWRLADDEQATVAISTANHWLETSRMQPTCRAGIDLSNEVSWCREGKVRHFVTSCGGAPGRQSRTGLHSEWSRANSPIHQP